MKINQSNKNDIIQTIGPPIVKSTFDNDVLIYIERKTSSSKLTKLGKRNLIVNNVLILDVDKKGILINKEFYNKDDMQKIKFDDNNTVADYTRSSFVSDFFFSLRQRIDDPLGKKRTKN